MSLKGNFALPVRNETGSYLQSGTCVFPTGYQANFNRFLITPASASIPERLPMYVLTSGVPNFQNTLAYNAGLVLQLNTSAATTSGVPVYLDSTLSGGWTLTRPIPTVNSRVIQIGNVNTVGANGSINFFPKANIPLDLATKQYVQANVAGPNTVNTAALQVGSVSGNVIGVGVILNGDIAVANISGNLISADTYKFVQSNPFPNTIPNSALQSASISGNAIGTGSILNGHLASASTSGNVIASDTVSFLKTPNPNTVGNAQLQSASVSGNAIATASIQANQIVPSVLSQGKNSIINGNMNIWQRLSGSGFTGITTTTYGPDRFSLVPSANGATFKMEQDQGIFPTGSASSLKISVTSPKAISGTTASALYYGIEGYDFQKLANQKITLSFWVYTNCPGIYAVTFYNLNHDYDYVANYTVNAANTWQKIAITLTQSTASGTWKYDTNVGMTIGFTLASGGAFQTQNSNQWNTGGNHIATYSGNTIGQAGFTGLPYGNGNYINFAQVQLELGDTPTAFEYVPFQQELAKCQRYFWAVNGGGQSSVGLGVVVNSAILEAYSVFPVRMRTQPTINSTAGFIWNASGPNGNQIGGYDYGLGAQLSITGSITLTSPQGNVDTAIYRFGATSFVSATNGQACQMQFGAGVNFGWNADY